MKKVLSLLLLFIVVICITGCDTNKEQAETKEETFEEWAKTHGRIEEFNCPTFYEKEIAYFDKTQFVTTNGEVYKIGNYSDGTNCVFEEQLEGGNLTYKHGVKYVKNDKYLYRFNEIEDIGKEDLEFNPREKQILENKDILFYAMTLSSDNPEIDYIYYFDQNNELIKETNQIVFAGPYTNYTIINKEKIDIGIDLSDQKILFLRTDWKQSNGEEYIKGIGTDKHYYSYKEIIENDCDKYDDIECRYGYVEDKKYAEYIKNIYYMDQYLNFITKDNKRGQIEVESLQGYN